MGGFFSIAGPPASMIDLHWRGSNARCSRLRNLGLTVGGQGSIHFQLEQRRGEVIQRALRYFRVQGLSPLLASILFSP